MKLGSIGVRRLSQYYLTRCALVGVLGWTGMVMGCVPSKVQVQSAPQFDPSSISSIAILPFLALQAPQGGYGQVRGGVRDPEEIRTQFRLPGGDQARPSDLSQDRYSVSETATKFITSRVESILRARTNLRVVGTAESAPIANAWVERSDPSLRTLAKEIGSQLHVDGVLMGKVRTYREREGTRIGARPAAVGFEMFLVQPSDGIILWKGEFFEEQKPLTQDVVGFFEKSGGFVTARELSELGIQKVLKTFPVGRVVTPAR